MQPHVTSETGVLRSVMLCAPHAIDTPHKPINAVQEHFYTELGLRPDPNRIAEQHEGLAHTLTTLGIDIQWATPVPACPEQHFTRDVAMVVGDTFIINHLKEEVRSAEIEGLAPIVNGLTPAALTVDHGIIEGGDVILYDGVMYVGMGDRTNRAGLEWLQKHFGDVYRVMPIPLAPDILHLDVVFNIVGGGVALIYPPALPSDFVTYAAKTFPLIKVTQEEQFGLATNVVSLSPKALIADARFTRVNEALCSHGIEVITIPYDEVAKMGGSLRCTTCPLIRE